MSQTDLHQRYSTHYDQVSREIVQEPSQNRRVTDICCTITFFILLGALIVLGIMQFSEYNDLPYHSLSQGNFQLIDYWGVIAIGGIVSLITAFIYVILIKTFTAVMVYTMIFVSMGILAAITLAGVIFGQLGVAIGAGITFLIYLIVLACLWSKIKLGIVLVEVASAFLAKKMYIFLTPLIKIVLTSIFGVFWVYSLNCLIEVMQYKQNKNQDTGKETIFIVYWIFVWLVVVFVLYYMMTFTIAVVCSHWYYRLEGRSSFLTAYKWMFKQFGSLVFGAIMIAVVTLARMMAEGGRRRTNNACAAICLSIIRCLLKQIEGLLKVLNHFTVIVIVLTGQGYIQGAKSTMGLLLSELALLAVTNIICNFLVFWGMIISLGVPSILAYFYLTTQDIENNQIGQLIGVIMIVSILVSTVVYQIVTEAVSCILIFYCFDQCLVEEGLISTNRFPEQQHKQIQNYAYSNTQSNPYGNENYQRM